MITAVAQWENLSTAINHYQSVDTSWITVIIERTHKIWMIRVLLALSHIVVYLHRPQTGRDHLLSSGAWKRLRSNFASLFQIFDWITGWKRLRRMNHRVVPHVTAIIRGKIIEVCWAWRIFLQLQGIFCTFGGSCSMEKFLRYYTQGEIFVGHYSCFVSSNLQSRSKL